MLIVAAGLASSPASAASWTYNYSAVVGSETYQLLYGGTVRGQSTVRSNATVTVYDKSADGWGQRLYWRVYGTSSWNTCVNTAGDGTSHTCNVTSGKFIQYYFCEKNGTQDLACTPQDGFQT